MFLSVFGFPILAVQLYLLRQTVQEGIWKPEISIGILKEISTPKDVMQLDELPNYITLNSDDFIHIVKGMSDDEKKGIVDRDVFIKRSKERLSKISPKIIIKNTGKSAAKSIKMQITLLEYLPQNISPIIYFGKAKSLLDKGFLVVNLETNVYPGDFNEYEIILGRDSAPKKTYDENLVALCMQYYKPLAGWSPDWRKISSGENEKYPHLAKQDSDEVATIIAAQMFLGYYAIGKCSLEVKLWADGITPITQKLIFDQQSYSDKTKKLLVDIADEAVRYENDHPQTESYSR